MWLVEEDCFLVSAENQRFFYVSVNVRVNNDEFIYRDNFRYLVQNYNEKSRGFKVFVQKQNG